jgi:hypothetical protein
VCELRQSLPAFSEAVGSKRGLPRSPKFPATVRQESLIPQFFCNNQIVEKMEHYVADVKFDTLLGLAHLIDEIQPF